MRDHYLKSIRIENFRGISKGILEDFQDINIFIGRNNTGKSSVLEALYLFLTDGHVDFLDRRSLRVVVTRRGWYGTETVSHLFTDPNSPSIIEGGNTQGRKDKFSLSISIPYSTELSYAKEAGLDINRTVCLKADKNDRALYRFYISSEGKTHYFILDEGYFTGRRSNTLFIDDLLVKSFGEPEKIYSVILKLGGRDVLDRVLSVLRDRYPDVRDVTPLQIGDRWVLHVLYEDRSIPFYSMGDGFKLAFTYVMLSSLVRGGYLIIEEPEQHQHPGSLDLILKALYRAARNNDVQIFISTHDIRVLDRFIELAKEEGGVLVKVYKLSLEDNILKATTFDLEELYTYRKELEIDLRL